jgi:hypothetical protein
MKRLKEGFLRLIRLRYPDHRVDSLFFADYLML